MTVDVLNSDLAATFTVNRAAAGTYDGNGNFVPGALVVYSGVVGVVEEMSPEEVVALNLGERVKKALTIYTETQILASSEATKVPADRIVWQSETYEVHTVAHRAQIEDLAHYEVVAFRVEGS
jgi:hypothetical protein